MWLRNFRAAEIPLLDAAYGLLVKRLAKRSTHRSDFTPPYCYGVASSACRWIDLSISPEEIKAESTLYSCLHKG